MKSEDFLFKIFWKLKDEVTRTDDGNCNLQVVLIPRFGRIGAIIWFFLTYKGKWVIEDKEDK